MTTESRELEQASQVGDPIPDPGLPPHEPRLTDVDPVANKRAERQVAALFGVATLATLGFLVAYFALPLIDGDVRRTQMSNLWLGGTLALIMLGLGFGAVHWAKTIMTSPELVQERHVLASDPQTRQQALAAWDAGVQESGFGRRKMIRNSLLGAMALLPLPAVVLLRDLGPLPGNVKSHTFLWAEGVRLVTDITFRPVRPADVELGAIVNTMPETFEELPEEGPGRAVARGKVPVILVRIEEDELEIAQGRENWQVDGILAYSKICTHVGCPINLYEQQTHHLLCPCHQSTFDLADNGKVIFGPAARSLPQLPIFIDDEGYLAARSDFTEPVGPSFWERD